MKVHTRAKRKLGLTTSHRHTAALKGKKKKNRPKTFKTEKAAHDYAVQQKLKKEQYTLIKVKKNKKFQVQLT